MTPAQSAETAALLSALKVAEEALEPLATVAKLCERHKDPTAIWSHTDSHGPNFALTLGHCRTASAALDQIRAATKGKT